MCSAGKEGVPSPIVYTHRMHPTGSTLPTWDKNGHDVSKMRYQLGRWVLAAHEMTVMHARGHQNSNEVHASWMYRFRVVVS